MIDGPEGAGFDYTVGQMHQVEAILAPYVGADKPIVRANPRVPGGFGSSEEMHTGRVSVFLQDWDKREQPTVALAAEIQQKLAVLTGVRARTQVSGGLVRSRGQPFQMVLGGPDYAELAQWRDRMMQRMEENPGLVGVDSDYKETRPQMRVNIDRLRAADLGVSVTEIGGALETMMGSRRAHYLRRQRRGVRRDAAVRARGPHVAGGPGRDPGALGRRRADSAVEPGHAR